jgi:hypothetical protein
MVEKKKVKGKGMSIVSVTYPDFDTQKKKDS